ncbi:MAG: hypothetical protein Q4E51_05460 [Lachnospiraceae bacterium]|nr:hypothetical protein [Lachnospiraceae bacterium]
MNLFNDEWLKKAREEAKFFKSNNYARMHGCPPMRGKANRERKHILKLVGSRNPLKDRYISEQLGISTIRKGKCK